MKSFEELRIIMKRLRDPAEGCPWDRDQTELSLREYILEEAYELTEAINSRDPDKIKDELGDLLLQIVFISQIMEEKGNFDLYDVATRLKEKIIERHPHIFGDVKVSGSEDVKIIWENIKKKDKNSILSDYPEHMPGLMTAKRISEQAASSGFDWKTPESALDKVKEELSEMEIEITNGNISAIEEEIGDLLFAIANVARKLNLNPELALKNANDKFKKRFRSMENICEEKGLTISELTPDEMEKLWEKIKLL